MSRMTIVEAANRVAEILKVLTEQVPEIAWGDTQFIHNQAVFYGDFDYYRAKVEAVSHMQLFN